jgi:putative ABC transport system permease protein
VRRTDLIPELETGGLSVMAVEPDLLDVLGADVVTGRFLDDALSELPVAVLGSVAAERLGVADLDHERLIYANGEWLAVIGIAGDLELHPDLERAAMIGYPVAAKMFGDVDLSAIYLRVFPEAAEDVTEVLPSTINPENPDQVEITRPADALAAREAADAALTQLLIALGSVALMVGGVAIANVMVMSVLERRMEIGVRRALGATRAHIRRQFLLEAVILAGLGGVVGAGLGAGITLGFSTLRGLPIVIPLASLAGAVAAALVIGALAGIYPAARAARIPPSQAVRGSQ